MAKQTDRQTDNLTEWQNRPTGRQTTGMVTDGQDEKQNRMTHKEDRMTDKEDRRTHKEDRRTDKQDTRTKRT